MRRRCEALTTQGRPCRAAPGIDSSLCFMHDPATAEEAAAARHLGGQRRKREGTITAAYALESLETVPGLRRLLDAVVADALALDTGVARLRILLGAIDRGLKLFEVGELAARVDRLEVLQRAASHDVLTSDLVGSLLDDIP
jgi:hypothetical protein